MHAKYHEYAQFLSCSRCFQHVNKYYVYFCRLVTELSVYQSKEFGNTEARKKTVTMFNSPFTQPSSADQADGAQDNKPRLLPPDLKNALNNALKQRQKYR